MMAAMMLPSLVPTPARQRRALRLADTQRLGLPTALVAAGRRAITAERLAPAPALVTRTTGILLIATGALAITRAITAAP